MRTDESNMIDTIDTTVEPQKYCKYASANTVTSNWTPKTSVESRQTQTVRSSMTHGSISIRTIPMTSKRPTTEESTT